MADKPQQDTSKPSRREFIKKGSSLLVAGGVVAGSLKLAQAAHAFGSDTIKIGLVGCGGRGTQAAIQAMNTEGGAVHLVALGDVFPDRLQQAYRGAKSRHGDKVDVPRERQFVGFDAYKRVLECDIDLVILATPPGFRPLHFEAAVKAGKHIFAEKPLATDAAGVRRLLAANDLAKKQDLAVAIGLQRHHEQTYKETMAKLHDGAIGDIVSSRCYWNGRGVWVRPRENGQSELEYQMRNWYYFNWLCGDHINEQHIHNIDVINWLMNDYPVSAQGMGGREVRNGLDHGHIFDHHFIEFTYANGAKMWSQCRHIPNCWNSVAEFTQGTKGRADISGAKLYDMAGNMTWRSQGSRGGHQQEHHDLFAELRKGNRPNEGDYGAKSTLTAIMGRMATYSGKMITWKQALNAQDDLANFDILSSMSDQAPIQPDENGRYAVPVPGKTKVV